jgi:hypothetical protein
MATTTRSKWLRWFVAARPIVLRAMSLGAIIWLATHGYFQPLAELAKVVKGGR